MNKKNLPYNLSLPLGEAQELFARLLPNLLNEILSTHGYTIRLGELWRPPEMVKLYAQQGKGSLTSVHPDKLAIDINLFKNGEFLQKTSDHAKFGKYWETLHPLTRWGGDFGDGNHYSIMIWDYRLKRWRA